LDAVGCEVILVKENVVVSWLARAEQACVAVEVIIGFDWAHDIGVNDRASAAVPLPVTVAMGPREEDYFVVLGDDNKCDGGFEIQSCTCVSDEIEFFIDNCSEFSFRDAIAIE